MMEEFKIYIDRLKDGETQQIVGDYDPSFLDISETELQFKKPVQTNGEAYLTDDHLVIHFSAKTTATMPCSMCNEPCEHLLSVDHFYHTEALTEIPAAVYDFGLPLREALLIELPHTVECNGHCAARELLTPYMRKTETVDKPTHFPFANFD